MHSAAVDYYEEEPILYGETAPQDAITRLQSDYASGVREFTVPAASATSGSGAATRAQLEALLKDLGVSPESQLLVFSKTSLQSSLISPSTPRAIFFSDECYVGWVPGGRIEVACYGPAVGPAFYLAEMDDTDAHPVFIREEDCLSCHTRTSAPGTPGLMVRSVFSYPDGQAALGKGTFLTTYQSPISERWGGWYVTGKHGDIFHMGNKTLDSEGTLDRASGANRTTLTGLVDTRRYPVSTSDIVAFLVLEHQASVHNALTEGSFRTRRARHLQDVVADALGDPRAPELEGTALSVANSSADKIVETLLFYGEAEFPADGITGNGDYEKAFLEKRRTDAQGHSLRDFQLLTRTFKNRCSYMIHSGAFESLLPALKMIVWEKLHTSLTEDSEKFGYLGKSERRRILSILKETVPDLPKSWH